MQMSNNDIFQKLKNYNLPNFGWKKLKKFSSDKRDIGTSLTNHATAKHAILVKWSDLSLMVSEDIARVLCAESEADSLSNLMALEEDKDVKSKKKAIKVVADLMTLAKTPVARAVRGTVVVNTKPSQTKEDLLQAIQLPMNASPSVYPPVSLDDDFLDDKDKETYRELFMKHQWKVSDRFDKGYYGTFMGVSFTFLLSMIDKSKYMYKIGSWNCPISHNSKDLKVVMNHAFEEAWRDYF
jgi:hypothetical protein